MEAETVLTLFDSYWFNHNVPEKALQKKLSEMSKSHSKIPTLPTIHTKTPKINSNSPEKLVSKSSGSPYSILLTSKLQTIFSRKILEELEDYSMAEIKTTHEKLTLKTTSLLKGSSSTCTGIASRRK